MDAPTSIRWSDQTVAVTGAGGFIGSQLTHALVMRGAQVRALVHYRGDGGTGLIELLPDEIRDNIQVIPGDIRDSDWTRASLRGTSRVFHLAALIGIPYSFRSPRQVIETNLVGTLNVLEAVRANEIERMVQTSTSEVYGSAQMTPMSEAHPLCAQSPYAASKVGADQLAVSYHRSFGVPVSIARPFNTYGPGQTARAVVPTIISQALTKSVVRLGSTHPTRDLNFVADTVEAFLAISASPATVGDAFNIATGVETSVGNIVELVGEILGRELSVEPVSDRIRPERSEVDRLVGDPTKLNEVCGWAAQVPLRDGLTRTIDWIEEHADRFRPNVYDV